MYEGLSYNDSLYYKYHTKTAFLWMPIWAYLRWIDGVTPYIFFIPASSQASLFGCSPEPVARESPPNHQAPLALSLSPLEEAFIPRAKT